jgi:hypothetical protein
MRGDLVGEEVFLMEVTGSSRNATLLSDFLTLVVVMVAVSLSLLLLLLLLLLKVVVPGGGRL